MLNRKAVSVHHSAFIIQHLPYRGFFDPFPIADCTFPTAF
jgi:hypothetical protein